MTDDTMVERMARLMHADDVARGRAPEQAWENVTSQMRACYVDNATALLPLVREAQEKVWEQGLNTGIGYASVMALPGMPEPENPYRTGDDHE